MNCVECVTVAAPPAPAIGCCIYCGSGVCVDHVRVTPVAAQPIGVLPPVVGRRRLTCTACIPIRRTAAISRWQPSRSRSRLWRRVALAYHLRCARDDARARHLLTPTGVWACHHCAHVSLDQRTYRDHLAGVH
jgi:hypothetical protein